MTGPFVAHLLQSTACALLAAALMLILRVRRPAIRHALWMLAILKFALPAVALGDLGRLARSLFPAPASIAWPRPLMPLAQVAAVSAVAAARRTPWDAILLAIWVAGFLLAVGVWIRRLHNHRLPSLPASAAEVELLQRLRRRAGIRQAVALRHSAQPLAPGVAGYWKPSILIHRDLVSELEAGEFESVLLHELAHVKRGDNLWSAAAHALACLFWFYPPIWWLERRALAESEQACDEWVVRWGAPPDRYAAAILKVCRSQIEVSLAGVSGIGSGLSGRIEWILAQTGASRSSAFLRCVPVVFAGVLAMLPIAAGFLIRPAAHAQTPATPVRCWYRIPYPEGTVIHAEGTPYDQMCVVDKNGRPQWIDAAKANRARVGEVVYVARPDPQSLVCEPSASTSATECTCSNGKSSSLGAVLYDPQGHRIRCDKWFTRRTAEWRPFVPGKDSQ